MMCSFLSRNQAHPAPRSTIELCTNEQVVIALLTSLCRDQAGDYEGSSHLDNVKVSHNDTPTAPVVEWWAEDLAVLRFDFFQKVLAQMRTRGMRCESLGGAVMHYAHRALKGIHKRQIMKSPKPQVLIVVPVLMVIIAHVPNLGM